MGVWIAKLFRSLFLLIDRIIYWAVNMVYQLFMMIAETGVFRPEDINKFAGRIYALLGIFMLFKVSFSLITYILNPDQFMDKEKGVGKLLINFFVVLVGIVSVPYVFGAAFKLQNIVLKENVIGNLIMGMNASLMDPNNTNYIEQGGNLMSYTTLSAFIRLNETVVGAECADNPVILDTDDKAKMNPDYCTSSALTMETSSGDPVNKVLVDAYTNYNFYYLVDNDLVNLRTEDQKGNETWLFEYNFIISSIAGGFLAWILLMFCIDIAVRSVKLGFLQIIAPIPIISYIDPKSKDKVFKKWVESCTKTYLDLFIRLVAIYFAIFIISTLINGGMFIVTDPNTPQRNIFVMIFIIFGALMFAKQLPKLIEDLTGAKLDGGFTLNPMKKAEGLSGPFAGLAKAGLTAAGGSMLAAGRLANAPASALANKLSGGKLGHTFGESKGLAGARIRAAGHAAGSQANPFAKDETMGSSYRENMNKNRVAYQRKLGERLLSEEKNNENSGNIGGIFKSPKFREAYKNMYYAKKNRDSSASDYEKTKMEFDRGIGNHTAQEVDNLRIKSVKAKSNFDNMKKEFEREKVLHDSDAERYDAYSYADDLDKGRKVAEGYGMGSSSTSSSSTSSSTSSRSSSSTNSTASSGTVGGVNVSEANRSTGERTTSSGIIIPGGTKLDDKK